MSIVLATAAAVATVTTAGTAGLWFRSSRRSRAAIDQLADKLEASEYAATHDELTGVLNRSGFYAAAQARLAHWDYGFGTVLLVDLDGMKAVNDTRGHGAGDVVLVAAAAHLNRVFGPLALVARLGGDEFAVLTDHLLDSTTYAAAAGIGVVDIADGIRESVTASVGATLVTGPADLAVALAQADAAMYRAKQHHGSWALYEADRDDDAAPADRRPIVRTRDLDQHVQLQLLGVVA